MVILSSEIRHSIIRTCSLPAINRNRWAAIFEKVITTSIYRAENRPRLCFCSQANDDDENTLAGLGSIVTDLEELLDLVEGWRLEVLDGDVVDGETLDRGNI